MTTADPPTPIVNPRPGVASTLGVMNIVFAVLLLLGLFSELMWVYAATRVGPMVEAKEAARTGPNPAKLGLMGMDDVRFTRFCLADALTGFAVNLAMLASGIGLVNLQRWGGKLAAWTAWIKLVRLVLLCGIFVIGVTPSLSTHMAEGAITMVPRPGGVGKGPTVADFTRIYSIMCLIMTAIMLVLGSIFPIFSLWLLSRPGVQAALAGRKPEEPRLP